MIFTPPDNWEVVSPHGEGIVLYIETRSALENDLWCVATKWDGQIRHYQTIQLKLVRNQTLDVVMTYPIPEPSV